MRLTKYPQSCLIVEHDGGGRLLIDPGSVAMDVHGATVVVLGTEQTATV